jgi:hypothetical protein
LSAVGKSTGLVLPQKNLNRLHVTKKDFVVLVEVRGGYFLAPYDQEISEQVSLGLDFMNEYKKTFGSGEMKL